MIYVAEDELSILPPKKDIRRNETIIRSINTEDMRAYAYKAGNEYLYRFDDAAKLTGKDYWPIIGGMKDWIITHFNGKVQAYT